MCQEEVRLASADREGGGLDLESGSGLLSWRPQELCGAAFALSSDDASDAIGCVLITQPPTVIPAQWECLISGSWEYNKAAL